MLQVFLLSTRSSHFNVLCFSGNAITTVGIYRLLKMLVVHLISMVFQTTIYLLQLTKIKLSIFQDYNSFKSTFFSLLSIIIVVQCITKTLFDYYQTREYLNKVVYELTLTLIIPFIVYVHLITFYTNHSLKNHSLRRRLIECNQKVYHHRHAAIIAIIYFLIPKHYHQENNHDIIIHITRNISFLINLYLNIFISAIINDSTIRMKPHSFICHSMNHFINGFVSTLLQLRQILECKVIKNNILFHWQIPYELQINLWIYHKILSIINWTEKIILYIIITNRYYYKNKYFLILQQFICFFIGYFIIFTLILFGLLNGFFGEVSIIIKISISLSVGHWILFSLVLIHIFPLSFHGINEFSMGIEVIINGAMCLTLFSTLNTPVWIRNVVMIPLALLNIFVRYHQCQQIRESHFQENIVSTRCNKYDETKRFFYSQQELQELQIFEWFKNVRTNFKGLSQSILLPYILSDIPTEIVVIVLSYIDYIEPKNMIENKWEIANNNIDEIFKHF